MRGELVDPPEHGDVTADAQTGADDLEVLDGARAEVRPHDVGEETEDAVHVLPVGLNQAVREQMQAQVRVVGVDRSPGEVRDRGAHHDLGDLAGLVGADQQRKVRRDVGSFESLRARLAVFTQRGGPGTRCRGRCRPPRCSRCLLLMLPVHSRSRRLREGIVLLRLPCENQAFRIVHLCPYRV